LLFDSGVSVGTRLVQHPLIKAAAFTGSHTAGRALFDIAARRADPIPFYGEMASTNPLFILPGALAARGEKIAADLFASFTLGAGQFCTKPGLVFVNQGAPCETFLNTLREKTSAATPFTLLTAGIASSFNREVSQRNHENFLQSSAHGKSPEANGAA